MVQKEQEGEGMQKEQEQVEEEELLGMLHEPLKTSVQEGLLLLEVLQNKMLTQKLAHHLLNHHLHNQNYSSYIKIKVSVFHLPLFSSV